MTDKKLEIDEYVKTEDAVFHYTKLSTAVEHILSEKHLKLSLPINMSDPAESKELFFGARGVGFLCSIEEGELARNRINKRLRNEYGILCFCSNKKPELILESGDVVKDEYSSPNGWMRPRMWSQYAEDHMGVCLIFSKEKLEQYLNDQEIKYKSDYVKYFQKTELSYKAGSLDSNEMANRGEKDYPEDYINTHFEELFYQKHIDYRDEAEYRIIIPDQSVEYLDIGSSIKGVVAGEKTPKVYFPLIQQLCDKLQIESRRAYLHNREWLLCLMKN
jgi:hypothetical protein